MTIARPSLLSTLALGLALGHAAGADIQEKNDKRNVTVIKAESRADGSSQISRELVKECIIALPNAEAVEAEVLSDSRFLREINGDPAKNGWVKTYSARVGINYQLYRKDLLIVTTRSVEGKDPVFKDVEKRLPQSREFVSNPAEGDTYAGRSNKQYYFTKPEDAVKDVRQRAGIWLKQQTPLLCGDVR